MQLHLLQAGAGEIGLMPLGVLGLQGREGGPPEQRPLKAVALHLCTAQTVAARGRRGRDQRHPGRPA